MKKEKTVKAWMGFTDGKPYMAYNPLPGRDKSEFCIYETRKAAKLDFDDVRPCTITYEV